MLIALQDITFEFGARTIIEDSSWHIIPGDRVGLIGLNGTGKSTLLRIINGEYTISKGSINKIRNLSIGFFNQDLLSFETENSILSVGMTAFAAGAEGGKRAGRADRQAGTFAGRMRCCMSMRTSCMNLIRSTGTTSATKPPLYWKGLVSARLTWSAPTTSFPAAGACACCWPS